MLEKIKNMAVETFIIIGTLIGLIIVNMFIEPSVVAKYDYIAVWSMFALIIFTYFGLDKLLDMSNRKIAKITIGVIYLTGIIGIIYVTGLKREVLANQVSINGVPFQLESKVFENRIYIKDTTGKYIPLK